MSSEADLDQREQGKFPPENIDSAWDLSSGGLGIHIHSVQRLALSADIPKWAHECVIGYGSNYLSNPYTIAWVRPDSVMASLGPRFVTPRNEAHLALITGTLEEYVRLDRTQLRLVLGGEEMTEFGNLEAPFQNKEEFMNLLQKGRDRKLIGFTDDSVARIQIADNIKGLIHTLCKSGNDVSDNLITLVDAMQKSEQFRQTTLHAAVRKLGCMLALTDQITFDAKEQGVPYSVNYRPARANGNWESNWKKSLGEPMPGIGTMYEQGHASLLKFSDQNDELLAHIFEMPMLPQLTNIA